jgi:imidazolonepropionase-like amidohydrolase
MTRQSIVRASAVSLALAAACAQGQRAATQPTETAGRPDLVAFVDVSVLTMSSETVLKHQSVIVEAGHITQIGPRTGVTIPTGATVIDGRGEHTLLPGLVDAHTHSTALVDLAANLANGVTTILNMGQSATSPVMASRASITNGPRVYAGWFIDGPGGVAGIVSTPDAARASVRAAVAAKHEFIKVYNSLSTAQFDAIIDEAKAQHIAVIGHAVRGPGLAASLRAGQVMVAHAEEFIPSYFVGLDNTASIASAVDLARGTGAYVTANLSAFEAITLLWGKPAKLAEYKSRPEARYSSASDRAAWDTRGYERNAGSIQSRFDFVRALVRAMQAGGVPLLAGTDAPFVPGMFPGFAIHDELRMLVTAGLTPYQALSAATRTPGRFFQQFAGGPTVGVITVGARADLLLVPGDPLSSLDVLRAPSGVMVAGRWLNRATLLANLDAAVP